MSSFSTPLSETINHLQFLLSQSPLYYPNLGDEIYTILSSLFPSRLNYVLSQLSPTSLSQIPLLLSPTQLYDLNQIHALPPFLNSYYQPQPFSNLKTTIDDEQEITDNLSHITGRPMRRAQNIIADERAISDDLETIYQDPLTQDIRNLSSRRFESPTRESRFPTRRFESPTRESRFPSRRFESPTRESRFPTRRFESPTRESRFPTRRFESPTRESRFPKRFESPNRESRFPKQRFESPNRESRFPKQRFESPTRESPRRESAFIRKPTLDQVYEQSNIFDQEDSKPIEKVEAVESVEAVENVEPLEKVEKSKAGEKCESVKVEDSCERPVVVVQITVNDCRVEKANIWEIKVDRVELVMLNEIKFPVGTRVGDLVRVVTDDRAQEPYWFYIDSVDFPRLLKMEKHRGRLALPIQAFSIVQEKGSFYYEHMGPVLLSIPSGFYVTTSNKWHGTDNNSKSFIVLNESCKTLVKLFRDGKLLTLCNANLLTD